MESASIHELMNADPLELDREDIRRIIQHYRESRHLFNQQGPKKKSSASSKPGANLNLDIEI